MRTNSRDVRESFIYLSLKDPSKLVQYAIIIVSINKEIIFIKIAKEAAHTTSFTIQPRLLHPTVESLSDL